MPQTLTRYQKKNCTDCKHYKSHNGSVLICFERHDIMGVLYFDEECEYYINQDKEE